MRRREFITLLGGAAASWPLAARAQQATKTIGLLGAVSASDPNTHTAALVQRLHELGWIEGRTLALEFRWALGRPERAAELASELVQLKVDVIVTSATGIVAAVKQATAVVPIVFAMAADPLGAGLVASLARPGGNVTGLSLQSTDLAGKRLRLLREVVPGLRRLAILGNVGVPNAVLEIGEAQAAARKLGLDITTRAIRAHRMHDMQLDPLRRRSAESEMLADSIGADAARISPPSA
jgi:putative tryptophan/tyrosine transport system substrate-binding protein